MKAITYSQYGPPENLRISEVPKPNPKDNEVLIKVHAASVNPLDWHIMRGKPYIARLEAGLLKPRNPLLGADVAGIIEAVGKNVKDLRPGDEVFGAPIKIIALGSLAEYVVLPQEGLVKKPSNLTFDEAAAVPIAAITALQSLQHGQLKPGHRVLVNGASGGVGSFTVQLAKALGAEVTGVCSTRNLDLLQSLGADHVIDYTKEDFAASQKHRNYELVIDNVGNHSVSELRRVMAASGKCVIVGFTSVGLLVNHMFAGPLTSIGNKRKVGMMKTAQVNGKDLTTLQNMLETRKIRPVIDRRYSLDEAPQAIAYLEKGHARGKVLISVT